MFSSVFFQRLSLTNPNHSFTHTLVPHSFFLLFFFSSFLLFFFSSFLLFFSFLSPLPFQTSNVLRSYFITRSLQDLLPIKDHETASDGNDNIWILKPSTLSRGMMGFFFLLFSLLSHNIYSILTFVHIFL